MHWFSSSHDNQSQTVTLTFFCCGDRFQTLTRDLAHEGQASWVATITTLDAGGCNLKEHDDVLDVALP